MSSLPPVSETVPAAEIPAPEPMKPPGPGLPESLLWMVAFILTQFVAGILCFASYCFYIGFQAAAGNQPMPDFNPANFAPEVMEALGIAISLIALVLLVTLIKWRLGRSAGTKLNFSRPTLKQTVIVMSMIVPMLTVTIPAFGLVESGLLWLVERYPSLGWIVQVNGTTHIANEINSLQLLAILTIGMVPALGEELLCRGLMGRGLIARWGVVRGVLLTSILFGLLHFYPPHVASAFLLGVVMHIVYLATRSFWMPVLYHFLNNATVVVLGVLFAGAAAEETAPSPWIALGGLAYMGFALAMLWKYRTQDVDENGQELVTPYPSLEAPAPELKTTRRAAHSGLVLGLFAAILCVTVGSLAVAWLEETQKATADQTPPAAPAALIE